MQVLQVALNSFLAASDDLVAATVVAKRFAERYVYVQRQRLTPRIAECDVSPVVVRTEVGIELQRRRYDV